MKQQPKDVFMTLFTAIGIVISIIIYFVCTFYLKSHMFFMALSFVFFPVTFRAIGYLLDKKLASKK